jgi:hypothetical protein
MSIGSKLAALLLCPTLAWAHAPNGPSGVNVNGLSIARKPFITPLPATIIPPTPTPPGYQGPGDLVAGAIGWYGLRPYNAAYAGPLIRLHRLNDDKQCDIAPANNGLGSTINCFDNSLNGQDVTAFCNGTTCVVVAIYDQTGNGNDLTQTITASQPLLTFNCLAGLTAGLPCISFAGVQQFTGPNVINQAQPFSITVATNYTGSVLGETFAAAGNEVQVGYNAFTSDDIYVTAGTLFHLAGNPPGNFRVIQFIAHDPSSFLTIDGTATAETAGTNAFASKPTFGAFTGRFVECGMWPIALSTAQQTAINSNTHSYWGF